LKTKRISLVAPYDAGNSLGREQKKKKKKLLINDEGLTAL